MGLWAAASEESEGVLWGQEDKKKKNVYLDLKGGPFLRLVVIHLKMSSSWVNRLQFPDSLAAAWAHMIES